MRLSIKESIFSQVYENFVNSHDHNGLPIFNIRTKCDNKRLRKAIVELILENRIALLAPEHDKNPYIIRFGFVSQDDQVSYVLTSSGWGNACLYPCAKELQNRCLSTMPFVKMMELGYPQLMPCYFNWHVLNKYSENPQYDYSFHNYIGRIGGCLKTFGVGRNGDTIVAVACPRDLSLMPEKEQNHWFGDMITDITNCKILHEYKQNLFLGSWSFPNTVYAAVLLQMENINILTNEIWAVPFFTKTWDKLELKTFDMITMPTVYSYNDYLLLLEKVIISNINYDFFYMLTDEEKIGPDGKRYASLKCLEVFLGKYLIGDASIIMKSLKDLRNQRQTPAHKIIENKYDLSYFNHQLQLTQDVHDSLTSLKNLFLTHPKAQGIFDSLKQDADYYIKI